MDNKASQTNPQNVIEALADAQTLKRNRPVEAMTDVLNECLATDGPERMAVLRRLRELAVEAQDEHWLYWAQQKLRRVEADEGGSDDADPEDQ